MKLGEMKIGQEALITAVGGQGALRRRLLDMGLTPHTRVRVNKFAPMGDPMELTLRGYELTLRIADANEIDVDIVPGKGAAR
ncbi:MAG: FeoA family protein [Candidatus Fimadaptatus sp.]|jgi:ferrous iron transport protein A